MSGRRTGSRHVESPVRMNVFLPKAMSLLIIGLTKKAGWMSVVGLALLAASAGPSVFAQTACPQGVPPGDPRCGPSPSWHQDGQQEESAPPRPVIITLHQVWEDRWGAISNDVEGPMGVAEARRTREDAIAVAHADCVARGGDVVRCSEKPFVYRNSCVAFAWGNGRSTIQSMPFREEAVSVALDDCAQQAGEQCRIVYAGCSESVDVGYCPRGVKPPDARCRPPNRLTMPPNP